MKKILLTSCLCCLVIIGAACQAPEPPVEEGTADAQYEPPVAEDYEIVTDAQLGLTFGIPRRQLDDGTIYYGQFALQDAPADTPPLDGMQIFYFPPGLLQGVVDTLKNDPSENTMDGVANTLYTRSRLLYSIQFYSAGMWDIWMMEGKSIADITGNPINEELGRQEGRVYVYTEHAPFEQGLEETELASYREALAAIPGMRAKAGMIALAPLPDKTVFPAFSATDIYGETIDNGIFADHDLTMLNIWGTFCGPCIMEMPDLGELAAEMPEGTQLVGLVGDALNTETIELAQNIAEEAKAAFPHIVPDKALYDYLNRDIVAYPTTIFIDSQGNIVGGPVVGSMNRALYEEELAKRLQLLR